MKILKELFKFLVSREFFEGISERMLTLALSAAIFLGFFYTIFNYPMILLYLIIIGMIVMGCLMFYFLFPDSHQRINTIYQFLIKQLNKLKDKFRN